MVRGPGSIWRTKASMWSLSFTGIGLAGNKAVCQLMQQDQPGGQPFLVDKRSESYASVSSV